MRQDLAPAPRPAGDFDAWLEGMRAVLRGSAAADVPCGDCQGCCISGYPVPLRADDRVALARVPDRNLRMIPGGTAQMTARGDGTCPMLEGGSCSIYADRPQTCRDYDCRIFTAAGLEPDGARPVIQRRVGEWQFAFAGDASLQKAAAVARAAAFIRTHAALFPAAARAHSATAAAVLAVKAFALFMEDDADQLPGGVNAQLRAQAVLRAAEAFDDVDFGALTINLTREVSP